MALTEKLTAIADAIRVHSGKTEKLTLNQMPTEIMDLQTLNFEVVGNPQPASPRENTIWVNTDVKITGWYFSASEPETAQEGMVWFSAGAFSSVEFNALKKNGIMVYPSSAKQYVSGAWVEREAKIYQNGAWVDWWNGELYSYGDEFEAITGGWQTEAVTFYDSEGYVKAGHPRITDNGTSVTIRGNASNLYGGIYRTVNKVSFKGKTKLIFTGSALGDPEYPNGSIRCQLVVWSSIGSYIDKGSVQAAKYLFKQNFSGEATIDVTNLNEDYYVGFHVYAKNYDITMQKLKLE